MTETRKRNKTLFPLPEGVNINDLVAYYSRGWHYGKLEQIKGNEVGIHIPAAYGSVNDTDAKARLKWVSISDIKRIDV